MASEELGQLYDLVIEGGTLVTAATSQPADVAIVGEQVEAIGRPRSLSGQARKVVPAEGMLVLPGGVDPHCHYGTFLQDAQAEDESYASAAAYGGTTTILDFVFQAPPVSLHDAIDDKRRRADGRMDIDYGLHAIITRDVSFEVLDEISDVVRGGIPTIKAFMGTEGVLVDDGILWAVMREVASAGGLSLVHAEDEAIAKWLTKKYLHEGKTRGAYVGETRGSLVEEAAVRRALFLAERSGCPLYILHMASGAAVESLAEARGRGVKAYGETILAYLCFTQDRLWQNGERGLLWNNFPTLKHEKDRQVLWDAIVDDRLQVVSSDHWANTFEERMAAGVTIDRLQSGQAAVELRIPVLYHLGVAGAQISINRFVELVSTNPARLMGLYPKKGELMVGSDADIIVLDPRKTWVVTLDQLHMRSDWNCWEGWELTGRIVKTILRGNVLIDQGKWVGPHQMGRYLQRSFAHSLAPT